MKLKLNNTSEQIELIKKVGSRNVTESREASEAFAAFVGPVIQQVLMTAGTASSIYTDAEFDENDSPSYPLDLYYNEGAGHIPVWSQSVAGGLPTSQVEGMKEVKIATYRLDSAVSFLKRYAREARLDVVSKAIERMANEVLIKQERNAWAVILKALADATTNGSPHIISGNGTFSLTHLNKLLTLVKRLNESYSGNTPVAPATGLTDLYLSPEVKEAIRAFSFNQVTNSSTDLPAGVRENIYNAAGAQEIFGVKINELVELGKGKKYNTLFASFESGFVSADKEVIIGIDNSRGAFIRPVAKGSESGATFTALPDDQFNTSRVDKVGFYGSLEEGRICIDAKAIIGLTL